MEPCHLRVAGLRRYGRETSTEWSGPCAFLSWKDAMSSRPTPVSLPMVRSALKGLHCFARHLGTHELARLMILVAVAAFLADWGGKHWAFTRLGDAMIPLGALTLGVVRNEGFVFSTGHGVLFFGGVALARLIALAVLLVLCYRGAKMLDWHYAFGAALIVAGGLGNTTDLFFRGGVVDFIWVNPIAVDGLEALLEMNLVFNLADLFILIGIGMVAPLIQKSGRVIQGRVSRYEMRILR